MAIMTKGLRLYMYTDRDGRSSYWASPSEDLVRKLLVIRGGEDNLDGCLITLIHRHCESIYFEAEEWDDIADVTEQMDKISQPVIKGKLELDPPPMVTRL